MVKIWCAAGALPHGLPPPEPFTAMGSYTYPTYHRKCRPKRKVLDLHHKLITFLLPLPQSLNEVNRMISWGGIYPLNERKYCHVTIQSDQKTLIPLSLNKAFVPFTLTHDESTHLSLRAQVHFYSTSGFLFFPPLSVPKYQVCTSFKLRCSLQLISCER